MLAVTLGEEFRLIHRSAGVRYFGPYRTRANLERWFTTRVLPARTYWRGCLAGTGRPIVHACSATSTNVPLRYWQVDAVQHRQIVADFCDFLPGTTECRPGALEC